MSANKAKIPRGAERRRAPRLRVDKRAELLMCPASSRTTPTAVELRDVSATGIGVVLESPLPVGQKCVVKTDALPKRQSRLYTVVRAHPDGEGKFHVGMHSSHLMESSGTTEEAAPGHAGAIAVVLLLIAGVAGGAWYFLM